MIHVLFIFLAVILGQDGGACIGQIGRDGTIQDIYYENDETTIDQTLDDASFTLSGECNNIKTLKLNGTVSEVILQDAGLSNLEELNISSEDDNSILELLLPSDMPNLKKLSLFNIGIPVSLVSKSSGATNDSVVIKLNNLSNLHDFLMIAGSLLGTIDVDTISLETLYINDNCVVPTVTFSMGASSLPQCQIIEINFVATNNKALLLNGNVLNINLNKIENLKSLDISGLIISENTEITSNTLERLYMDNVTEITNISKLDLPNLKELSVLGATKEDLCSVIINNNNKFSDELNITIEEKNEKKLSELKDYCKQATGDKKEVKKDETKKDTDKKDDKTDDDADDSTTDDNDSPDNTGKISPTSNNGGSSNNGYTSPYHASSTSNYSLGGFGGEYDQYELINSFFGLGASGKSDGRGNFIDFFFNKNSSGVGVPSVSPFGAGTYSFEPYYYVRHPIY